MKLSLPITILLMSAPAMVGCYDAKVLHTERQESSTVSHLEEVDLGAFRVTLPHILGDATDSVVDFHAFGQVARRDRRALTRRLDSRGPELRSRMLLSIRGLHEAQFEEPTLGALRQNIAEVINEALEKNVVKQIGFYRFAFTTM